MARVTLLSAITGWLRLLVSALLSVWGVVAALLDLGAADGETKRALKKALRQAKTYDEWKAPARQLDNLNGFAEWRVEEHTKQYNFDEVSRRIRTLCELRRQRDYPGVMRELQTDFHRWMCGMTNPLLYRYPTGTKAAIRTYVNLVDYICRDLAHDGNIPIEEKHKAVAHIGRAYGHSALVLNSSVTFGAYHLGVLKALHEAGVLPRIIFGRSTGALPAALVCCRKDADDVLNKPKTAIDYSSFTQRGSKGSLGRKLRRFWNEGTLMDVDVLLQFAKDNIGEVTFLEAYHLTGRVLNIQVDRYHPETKSNSGWLLNYLTAPDILVYSAAIASCATTGVYAQVPILQKSGRTGSVVVCEPSTLSWSANLAGFHVNRAVERLRSLFNVNMFIVAEATVSQLPSLRLHNYEGFIPRALEFVMEEVWRGLAALSRSPWLRSSVTGALQTVGEPVTGDIVVFPVTSPGDLLRLLRNPNAAMLQRCVWRGEQQVWPHLEHIRTHVAIEQALHRLLQELRQHPSLSGRTAPLEHSEF